MISVTWKSRISSGLVFLFLLVAVETFIAVPLLSWRATFGESSFYGWLFAITIALVVLAAIWKLERQIGQCMFLIMQGVAKPSKKMWVIGVMLLGAVLRISWFLVFPAQPASDGATYIALATSLINGDMYQTLGMKAYWPPGYPFLLMPFLYFLGEGVLAVFLLNIALFLTAIILIFIITKRLFSEPAARLASLAIALWPSHIAMVGLPEKEQVIIVVILGVILVLYSTAEKSKQKREFVSGLILGGGCLIQPSLLFFPMAVVLTDLISRQTFGHIFARLSIIVLGMVIVVAPWTYRNYLHFHDFVPISTNGGSVLYRANNPLATGGYTARGEVDMSQLGELEADRLAGELAKSWILENPVSFLRLGIEKQLRFLGDDSTGIYVSLRRGGLSINDSTYFWWKLVSNSYWLVLWIVLFVGFIRVFRSTDTDLSIKLLPFLLIFFYFYGVHSIAESNGKYHVPLMGVIAILVGVSGSSLKHHRTGFMARCSQCPTR